MGSKVGKPALTRAFTGLTKMRAAEKDKDKENKDKDVETIEVAPKHNGDKSAVEANKGNKGHSGSSNKLGATSDEEGDTELLKTSAISEGGLLSVKDASPEIERAKSEPNSKTPRKRSTSEGAPKLPLPENLLRPLCHDFHDKCLAFLCGKHVRVGASSRIFQLPAKIVQKIVQMAIPPMTVLTGSSFDGDIRVWDLQQGNSIYTLRTADFVRALCVIGQIACVASTTGIGLWDLGTGTHVRNLRRHKGAVTCLASDGTFLASGSMDHNVCYWDLDAGGACKRVFTGHDLAINTVALNRKAGFLASGACDATVRVWNINTGLCVHVLAGHTSDVTSIHFGPGVLASCSWDKDLLLWELDAGRLLFSLRGHSATVSGVDFVPYSATSSSPSSSPTPNTSGSPAPGTGQPEFLVASSSLDRSLRLWDPQTGECFRVLQGHTEDATCVHVVNRGVVASGSQDNTVRVWDVATGRCISTLPVKHSVDRLVITRRYFAW